MTFSSCFNSHTKISAVLKASILNLTRSEIFLMYNFLLLTCNYTSRLLTVYGKRFFLK